MSFRVSLRTYVGLTDYVRPIHAKVIALKPYKRYRVIPSMTSYANEIREVCLAGGNPLSKLRREREIGERDYALR